MEPATFATGSIPLSPEQQALLLQTSATDRHAAVIGMEGDIDVPRLQRAWQAVVERHESLRLVFGHETGYRGLRQWVAAESPVLSRLAVSPYSGADDAQPRLHRIGEGRWQLQLSVPRLMADAESLQVLCHDLARAYAGLDAGDEPFQYRQYVTWRRELADEADAGQQQAYWTGHLQALPEPLPVRLACRHDPQDAGAGQGRHARRAVLPAPEAERIAARARSLGTTPQVLLQAAWWALLTRLNPGGFVGGWQHDCRQDYEPMQGAVGVFGKVLPVAVSVEPGESFAAFTARIAALLEGHVDAQEYWPVANPPCRSQLEAGFACIDGSAPLPAAGWEILELPGPMPCFELAMQVEWYGSTATLALFHNTRYTEAAALRLLEQLQVLLQSALARPETEVSRLAITSEDERRGLLNHEGPRLEIGARTTAHHVLAWGERRPEAVALVAADGTVSYRDLVRRVHALSCWFEALGVGQGHVVALDVGRSVDHVVALLATWHRGAAWVPLDPQWPAARREAVLRDAGPMLVLSDKTPPDGPHAGVPWREATLAAFDPRAYAAHPPVEPLAAPDGLAYLLYTSGSTGTPKGVAVEHAQLLNYAAAVSHALALDAGQRWGWTGSVAADLGHTALFGALFNGAALVVAQDEDLRDPAAFARFMRTRSVDSLKIVPSHLDALLEHEAPVVPPLLVLGGESTPRALVDRLVRLAPQCRIYNHYGPTETTVGVMVHRVVAGEERGPALPLSEPLANCRVLVLDEHLQLAPAGVLGEVYVGGAQLCRGYVGDGAHPAFIADPLRPGERLYRTGDLAYVRPEGGLRLAGRADHQVKIRGFRVEPAEVEAALLAQPGVRQALVLPQTAGDGGIELLACVVVEAAEGAADEVALRERLSALLPRHMQPSAYRLVDAFPRLPNGKIDRHALAALPVAVAEARRLVAPRTALEAMLTSSMADLLKREQVGIEDDFFDLGGHSLLVIKLIARIRQRVELEVAPRVVFDHPTAAELAEALRHLAPDPVRLESLAASTPVRETT
ncbi:amino acid adenylation domain-containing protein [Schlegelella sp. S2-27]|uniref:Amino acid adenylation domain-containing protein n=1 Tax=Caldimonas mangrovi TaxID=2944811 RepID=A0ABT0YQS0_9BURK|nr:non-ribosomal peptide synthetase [Caldimonas mangrovi]MCM5681090.1 amino acid adenylation domain-containing protein [Caldimonas mangrovi]